LRFDAANSTALNDEIRARLRRLAGSRMTADGVLVIDARRFRTQADNREDARNRLADFLRQATVRPKKRRQTRPTTSSVARRVDAKRRRAETKLRRGKVGRDE
jgi:ribosome-associated protein